MKLGVEELGVEELRRKRTPSCDLTLYPTDIMVSRSYTNSGRPRPV